MGTVALAPETARDLTLVGQPSHPAQLLEWLNLLDALTEPATLIERGLSEVAHLQRCGIRQPYRAAVVGTNTLGLLATLVLQLRGAEVLTLGRAPQPLLSPSRVEALPGWEHVWMSPALAQTQLVEEIGARYASTSRAVFEAAPEKVGPFDVIMVGSEVSSPMLGVARRLAERGVLVDLTLGPGTMEVWTATPTPCFLMRRQVAYRIDGDGRAHAEEAVRDLALADALYPGWLAKLLANSAETSQYEGLLSAYLDS